MNRYDDRLGRLMRENRDRIARVGSSDRPARVEDCPVVEMEGLAEPDCEGCGTELLPQYVGVYTPAGAFCQSCAQDMMDRLVGTIFPGTAVRWWLFSYVEKLKRKRDGD